MKLEHSKITSLSLILADEKDNTKSYTPVHKTFSKYASLNTDSLAIIDSKGNKISYKELDVWSDNIASTLSLSHARGERAAIISESQVFVIASILGVMKAGLVHVVIDPLASHQRIKEILADSSASAILTTSQNDWLLKYSKIMLCSIYDIFELKDIFKENTKEINISLEDSAYIVYTSGSTGKPKGVLVNHMSLAASTAARNIVYPSVCTFLMLSPLFCDSAFAGLWGTLTLGGTIILPSYQENRNPEAILGLIQRHKVCTLLCIPSLYYQIIKSVDRSGIKVPSLRNVIVAAENLDNSVINAHFASQQINATLFNEYGPTEATIWCTYIKFDHCQESSIGRPIPGVSVYILDDQYNPVPTGEKGELFVGGKQIAVGYFNSPNETDRRFVKDPFVKNSKSIMYKTGDLVRLNKDGNISFLGRKDNQVKIRGYRVEIEEVEKKINELPNITKSAIVPVLDEDDKSMELVGCIISEKFVNISELQAQLGAVLPKYKIPSRFYNMEKLPLTNNGKIDRIKLLELVKQLDSNGLKTDGCKSTNIPDTSDPVSLVTEMWKQLLNVNAKNIMLDVNFFDLGGHSLMVFKLQEMLQQKTGKVIPIVKLFRNTTIAEQSKLIQE
ncbi:MAG: non-ribosomal peptide synthetase [Rickettsiaceae bacterium]